MKPGAATVLGEALENAAGAVDVMADPFRWQTPEPTPNLPDTDELRDMLRPGMPAEEDSASPAVLWAVYYSLALHRHVKNPSSKVVFRLATREPGAAGKGRGDK
eukprot:3208378-Pyramimonas_sp.AAC.1